MPLLPIDLQTLFTQSNQVGKEQSAQREAIPQHQAMQGSQMAQKSEQRDNSVNQAQEAEEGAESIRERREKERRKRQAARGRSRQAGENKETPRSEAFSDPALGRKIDVSG